jgi:hypothetical protein
VILEFVLKALHLLELAPNPFFALDRVSGLRQ